MACWRIIRIIGTDDLDEFPLTHRLPRLRVASATRAARADRSTPYCRRRRYRRDDTRWRGAARLRATNGAAESANGAGTGRAAPRVGRRYYRRARRCHLRETA